MSPGPTAAPPPPGKCPLCRATITGSSTCPRCRADLSLVLKTLDSARRLRERARMHLLKGDAAAAIPLIEDSLGLEESPRARRFLLIARALAGQFIGKEKIGRTVR